tara:strand:- start:718 stop:1407 length:690 start_codon:yes stop_codon:yes gene_type:complete
LKVRDFSKLFFAILFLHLVVIYKPESDLLYMISKPLLLFSLLAFFIHKTAHIELSGKSWVAAALLFSMIGDIILMQDGSMYFLIGMGAFAMAHVFYILFYLNQKLKSSPLALLCAALVMVGGIIVLYKYVNDPAEITPYLYVYALVIGLHLLASTRFIALGDRLTKLAVGGALLFVVSDLLIAFNQFNGYDKYLHIAVMLTYGLAQYGITIGLISYLENNGKVNEHLSE